jgi:lysyl-tRNA synthetase class 2
MNRIDPSTLQKRAIIVKAIRDWFWHQNFLELETPQLVRLPSMEPYLEVFETQLLDSNRHARRAFLTSSPEYSIKKLMAAGVGNNFTICKSYRNGEDMSPRHNPEFTILEWYRVNADYTTIMDDCEQLFTFIGERLGLSTLTFRGHEYDLHQPWQRISVAEAFTQWSGVEIETLLDENKLVQRAKEKGYFVDTNTTWEEACNQIFLNEVEPHLGMDRPTILYDYPVAQAALSRRKASDPRFAERFEFYVAGLELGNAFSELTDWQEQLSRLEADREEKIRIGRTVFDVDMEFIEALKSGFPESAGIAVGVDRVVMLFLDAPDIQSVLLSGV